MQNGDEALHSIILVGRGLLVKMLITGRAHYCQLIMNYSQPFVSIINKYNRKSMVTEFER